MAETTTETPAYDALTDKERAWVDAYLARGLNQTAASRSMGYKAPERHGLRMSKIVGVQAAIKERLAAAAMEADEVLHRLSDMARASIEEILDGVGQISLDGIVASGRAHLVKGYSMTQHGPKVELHDAQSALNTLAKIRGLATERRTNLNVDLASLTEAELERIAAGEDPANVLAERGREASERP